MVEVQLDDPVESRPRRHPGRTAGTEREPLEVQHADEIQAEQLAQALGANVFALLLEATAAGLLVVGLGAKTPLAWLAGWSITIWGLSAARAIAWARYRKWSPSAAPPARIRALLVGGSGLSGLLWGGGAAMLWPNAEFPVHQIFLIVTVASVAAATSGFLLSHLQSLVAFQFGGLVALLLGLLRNGGDPIYSMIAGFSVPYAVILFLVARHINALLVRSHLLRIELAMAKEEAQVASRAKSEFISSISHELRTPLNAIIGFSEIMKQQMFGPIENKQYIDYSKDIHRSGTHLLAIINDILDLTKIEAGKMQVHDQAVDLAEALPSAVSILRDAADKGGLTVEIELTSPNLKLRCDERLLKQMLLNLLSNAIKFTPIGGRVGLTAWRDADDRTVIEVSDTGIGIAPEHIDLVMQSFGQVEGAMVRQHSGTGLGLPLVKAMAELHQSVFVLDSRLNIGTVARLEFPPERAI